MGIRERVEGLLKELEEKKLYFTNAVDHFRITKIQLSLEESLSLAEQLAEKDVFRWLPLIGYLLEQNASLDSRFFEVLLIIMRKVGVGRSQGMLIEHLVKIGMDQPELAIKTHTEVRSQKQLDLLLLTGWMLGGAGKSNFERVSEIVQEGITAPLPEGKVASLIALRVAFAEKMEPRWNDFVFSLLRAAREERDRIVRMELVNVYFLLYDHWPRECYTRLARLVAGDDDIRLRLSELLCSKRLGKHHFALLAMLSTCASNQVLDNVSESIAFRSEPADTVEGLGIIHEWLRRDKFHEIGSLPLALNRLGEHDLALCLKQLETWVREGDYKIGFAAPEVAVEFAHSNLKEFTDKLLTWMDDKKLLDFSLKTARVLLHHIFEVSNKGKKPSSPNVEIIKSLLTKLKAIAQKQGLQPERIAKREDLSIYQCLILIEEIEKQYEELDYRKISNNLKRFPNIRTFLGENWFKRTEREKDRTHPLLTHMADLLDYVEYQRETENIEKLADEVEQRRAYWCAFHSLEHYALLRHLEHELGYVAKCRNFQQIKSALRSEERFWKVFSEIDVIARLMLVFHVEISPKLVVTEGRKPKVKRPDLEVTIDSAQVLVEVISPETFRELKYFGFAGIPNRVRGKIKDEVKKHFKGMNVDRDILIVIDTSDSEISYSSIQDYVDGPLQFMMRIDKRTGEVVDTFTKRGAPMAKTDSEVSPIIGIIGYRRVLSRTDGKIHLKGRSFPNPGVLSSGKKELLQKVAESLLG